MEWKHCVQGAPEVGAMMSPGEDAGIVTRVHKQEERHCLSVAVRHEVAGHCKEGWGLIWKWGYLVLASVPTVMSAVPTSYQGSTGCIIR